MIGSDIMMFSGYGSDDCSFLEWGSFFGDLFSILSVIGSEIL